ncbi:type II toxin-antitoxin system PemK/MazF family toxin [Candidatus Parcubacteria bacterium]|nr:type II toxin-antitoxin system PemK/MazF family toxin [Candidatus Parcubacteria bacterium]
MKKGEIWLVKFIESKSVGHEYMKDRPALIIESNKQIQIATVVTIMPMTSSTNKYIDDIAVKKDLKNRLNKDSLIKVYHVISFDKARFIHKIGEIEFIVMAQVEEYLKKHFGL